MVWSSAGDIVETWTDFFPSQTFLETPNVVPSSPFPACGMFAYRQRDLWSQQPNFNFPKTISRYFKYEVRTVLSSGKRPHFYFDRSLSLPFFFVFRNWMEKNLYLRSLKFFFMRYEIPLFSALRLAVRRFKLYIYNDLSYMNIKEWRYRPTYKNTTKIVCLHCLIFNIFS